ncbi:MAG: adenylyl-sulfate kinase [bacterium]|nr:MAG: adenylyl-sulfate kinase [bacterium]
MNDDDTKSNNITWHHAKITRTDREKLLNQRRFVIWFTGLSASGKSTIAHTVEEQLYDRDILTYVLEERDQN